MKKVLFYTPRVLSILIVLFFSMFILEGFDSNFGWQSGVAHLLLALVVLAITIIAWKLPKIGGGIFIAFGVGLLFVSRFNPSSLLIAIVPLITGILFLLQKNKQ